MTTYGTIPTETPELSNGSLSTRVRQLVESGFGAPRPWDEVTDFESLKLPSSFANLVERIQTNAAVYRTNYAIIIVSIVFVSLFWNPASLIFLIILIVGWLFLYFFGEGNRLTIYGYEIDDRILMTVLLLGSIAFLFLTDVMKNVVIGLSIGTVAIVVHAGLRSTDDDLIAAGDLERVGSLQSKRLPPLPLKHTASASFSSS